MCQLSLSVYFYKFLEEVLVGNTKDLVKNCKQLFEKIKVCKIVFEVRTASLLKLTFPAFTVHGSDDITRNGVPPGMRDCVLPGLRGDAAGGGGLQDYQGSDLEAEREGR